MSGVYDDLSSSTLELQKLRLLIREKEENIRRKEKKLELLKKAEGGDALREAEERLRRVGQESVVHQEEAERALRKTLSESGIPLSLKKEELQREIEEVEKEQEEQEARLARLDADLRAASFEYNKLKSEKQELCKAVLGLTRELRSQLLDKMEQHEDLGGEASTLPYALLQSIAELTKDREGEISNNDRQLRETCQIVAMKKQREVELQAETDERIVQATRQKDDEILELAKHCDRERQDLQDRVTRLEEENKHFRSQLHWKHQKTLRDMKERKVDRTSKRPIREQIVLGRTKSKKKTGDEKKVEESRVLPSPRPERDATLNQKKDSCDDERLKIRKMEGEISKMETDFARSKKQLEYKISYERGQAEQFERENQKLEAQAEHLAQQLQALKAEIKRRNASVDGPVAPGSAAATPRGGSRTPRSGPPRH